MKKSDIHNRFDLPSINRDDSARDYTDDPNGVGFQKKSRPSPSIPDLSAPSAPSVQPEGYAPYHGRETRPKKKKQQVSGAGPAPQNDERKSKERTGNHRAVRFIAKLLLTVFIISYLCIFFVTAFSGFTKEKLTSNSYIASSELHSSPFVRNILLIGVDGTDSSKSLRSDSMILVSLDSLHCKIKLSSFMRDSWVYIPDHGNAKLNAACAYGGPQLLVDTLEYNFKVNIHDYVLVDFTMFTDIIDEMGGIDVEVTNEEARFINRTTRHTIESGSSVHLNGAQALVYCRIRKLDSDYMRTYRQRKVISAIIAKARKTQPQVLFETARKILPKIKTNMNSAEIALLAYRGGFSLLLFPIRSTRIPLDELSHGATKNGQSVVEIDVDANAEYLYSFIYTFREKGTDSE